MPSSQATSQDSRRTPARGLGVGFVQDSKYRSNAKKKEHEERRIARRQLEADDWAQSRLKGEDAGPMPLGSVQKKYIEEMYPQLWREFQGSTTATAPGETSAAPNIASPTPTAPRLALQTSSPGQSSLMRGGSVVQPRRGSVGRFPRGGRYRHYRHAEPFFGRGRVPTHFEGNVPISPLQGINPPSLDNQPLPSLPPSTLEFEPRQPAGQPSASHPPLFSPRPLVPRRAPPSFITNAAREESLAMMSQRRSAVPLSTSSYNSSESGPSPAVRAALAESSAIYGWGIPEEDNRSRATMQTPTRFAAPPMGPMFPTSPMAPFVPMAPTAPRAFMVPRGPRRANPARVSRAIPIVAPSRETERGRSTREKPANANIKRETSTEESKGELKHPKKGEMNTEIEIKQETETHKNTNLEEEEPSVNDAFATIWDKAKRGNEK